MITSSDSFSTIEFKNYFVILPTAVDLLSWKVKDFIKKSDDKPGKFCKENFSYNSLNNHEYVSVKQLKKWKKFLKRYLNKLMTKPFPKVLRIEPASKCNLGCVHCPTGTIEMTRGVMSLEIFEKIILEIKKNVQHIKVIVLYHGGEPFLNKNFFYMLNEIKKINKDIFVKTVSNGTVLNEKIIKKIVESDLDLIEFSLDGQSAEDSEKIRKK